MKKIPIVFWSVLSIPQFYKNDESKVPTMWQ